MKSLRPVSDMFVVWLIEIEEFDEFSGYSSCDCGDDIDLENAVEERVYITFWASPGCSFLSPE